MDQQSARSYKADPADSLIEFWGSQNRTISVDMLEILWKR